MRLGWSDREEAIAASLVARARSGMYRRAIALAGFMGVGKSSVGRLLADVLDRPFYDTDSHVEAGSGRTVESFFPEEEAEFRRLEAEAVAELVRRAPSVIALGGGVLLQERSRRLLREGSLLVHLHVPWTELRDHIPSLMAARPLLRGKTIAEVHRLYVVRLATYREATLRVTIGRRGPAEAAADVLRALAGLERQAAVDREDWESGAATVLQALAKARATSDLELERTVSRRAGVGPQTPSASRRSRE
jgi:shikimate kinase